MSDDIFPGVGTHEYVAWKLLEAVGHAQNKVILGASSVAHDWRKADKDWILDTYVECWKAAHGSRLPDKDRTFRT